MKIFSIILCQIDVQPAKTVASVYELASFGYFQRGSIQEFMTFFSKTLAERTKQPGQRQSVENQDYIGHIFCRRADLSAVIICDKEYPRRVAFAVLNQAIDEFLAKFPQSSAWATQASAFNTQLKQMMDKYQNPREADNLMKIQQELDETKIIMHKTIESVLQRGDRLEDLVAKSDELSLASKAFYKTAKETNSGCCKIM